MAKIGQKNDILHISMQPDISQAYSDTILT